MVTYKITQGHLDRLEILANKYLKKWCEDEDMEKIEAEPINMNGALDQDTAIIGMDQVGDINTQISQEGTDSDIVSFSRTANTAYGEQVNLDKTKNAQLVKKEPPFTNEQLNLDLINKTENNIAPGSDCLLYTSDAADE